VSLYLDTAYIAKCYVNEPDAPKVRALVKDVEGLTSSAWCRPEMACVLLRHVHEGALDRAQARALHDLFLDDVRSGVFSLAPLSTDLLDEVEDRLQRLRKIDLFLRAGDIVHLLSARREGFKTIWTNDRHMLRAAPRFGLRGRSV
jgi:predicted nucleic acid-binding protein